MFGGVNCKYYKRRGGCVHPEARGTFFDIGPGACNLYGKPWKTCLAKEIHDKPAPPLTRVISEDVYPARTKFFKWVKEYFSNLMED